MGTGDQKIQAIPPEDIRALRQYLSLFLQQRIGQPLEGYPYPMAAGPTPLEQQGAGIIGRLAGMPSGVNPLASPFMGISPQAPGVPNWWGQGGLPPAGTADVPYKDVTKGESTGKKAIPKGSASTGATGTAGMGMHQMLGGPGYNYRPQGGLNYLQTPQGLNQLTGDYWSGTDLGLLPYMMKWR